MKAPDQTLLELILELIIEGEQLAPQGSQGIAYDDTLQPDYLSWRRRAIAAIRELRPQTERVVSDLENDPDGPYFYRKSANRVLGELRAAQGIIRQERQAVPTDAQDEPLQIHPSIFIVHGHDEALLHQTARFLEQLDLRPIFLKEQPGKSRTIIEKFEEYSDVVTFAVILLTPDDVGKAVKEDSEPKPRARQNVIFEFGYFLGKLGRPRITALYDPRVELPSDYRGVEYIKVDAEEAWKTKLAQELKAAGLPVDMNKYISKAAV